MTTKQQIWTACGIFLAITVLLAVLVVYPLFDDIKKASDEILFQKSEIASVGLRNEELDNFRKKYEEYKPNLEKSEALFINAKDPIDFITFLEKAAADSDVVMTLELLDSREKSVNNWPSFLFQIIVEGNFAPMLVFSEKLEASPYLSRTQRVTFRKHEKGPSQEELSGHEIDAEFLVEAFAK